MSTPFARSLSRLALPVAAAALLATPAAAQQAFDQSAWSGLLKAHVVNGIVDYPAFKAAPEFEAYLGRLAAFDPATLPTKDRLAFWINAYNAYTIELILRHDETESIRNINKTLFLKAYGPWKEKLAVVGGTAYGLDQIEQDIIRPEFKEPRIHFALVCAAMGCPPLRSEAYAGARLDALRGAPGIVDPAQRKDRHREHGGDLQEPVHAHRLHPRLTGE